MEYEDRKVKVTVVESHCPKYKEGDVICFTGSEIDKEHSDRICMVAHERAVSLHLRVPERRKAEKRPVPVYGLRRDGQIHS